MTRGSQRVVDLAQEAGLDLDEALVALWDEGIEAVEDRNDMLRGNELTAARRALGVTSPAEVNSVAYWIERTGLSREEFAKRAADAGIRISPAMRRLPKGGARRLARLFPTVPPGPPAGDAKSLPPLTWEVVGSSSEVRFLTEEEVLMIHELLEEDFVHSEDPIWPPGVKDSNLLSSAVARQHTGLGNVRKYPTIEMASAALFHSLALNHAFHNGNKRTALVALLAQLDENGLVLTATEQELFRFTLRTAQHGHVPRWADALADRELMAIARWIRANTRPVQKGERPMKWVRLKQRLASFGCTWEPATGVGNRLNVYREVPVRRRLPLAPRKKRLWVQVACAGDGTEADKNTVHMLRRRLELDDKHDVDSATFYAGATIDAFIIDYRRILGRLAKL